MAINSLFEIPSNSRKRNRKKRLTLGNIIGFSLALCGFILLCICTCQMFYRMSQHNKITAEFNLVLQEKNNLIKTNSELSSTYASKKALHDERQKQYGEAIANSPIAYLTFDDGPSDNTIKLLDILDKYKVKATFFVVYKDGYDEVYKEIVKRGHVLANHTYSHKYKDIYTSSEAFIDNVLKLDKKLEEITGVPPSKILRFPGGSNVTHATSETLTNIKSKLAKLGYSYFDWNVDSTDATALTQPKEAIVNGVLQGADLVNTANVLMHDMNIKHTTLDALPEVIEGLKAKGYRFKGLDHEAVKIQF